MRSVASTDADRMIYWELDVNWKIGVILAGDRAPRSEPRIGPSVAHTQRRGGHGRNTNFITAEARGARRFEKKWGCVKAG